MNTLVDTPSLVHSLNSASTPDHERLENRIMAAVPFHDREHYARFLEVQHAFYRDIDALYFDANLEKVLPDLAARRRLALIKQDFADLGIALPELTDEPRFGAEIDLPTALGWLYVAEGSNLGAASLLKRGAALGLSEEFGARHLAAAPEGRGLHWRTFTTALDAVELSGAETERVIEAAHAAFDRVHALAETLMPVDPDAASK